MSAAVRGWVSGVDGGARRGAFVGADPAVAEGDDPIAVVDRAPAAPAVAVELTSPEREVSALIGRGRANSEIAHALGISAVTVKTHVGHIFGKLGVRDRAAAIVYAFDHGVVSPGQSRV